jgi:hypothetical protein
VRPLGLAALALCTVAGPAAAAGDAPRALLAEVSLLGGGRTGSGTDDAVVAGGSLSAGVRLDAFRLGVVGRAMYSRSFGALGVDVGGYASWDFLSVLVDRTLSAGFFARLDLLARDAPALGRVGFVGLASVGLRAVGFSLSFALGPELGLQLGPGGGVGLSEELRVGVELLEVVALVRQLGEQSAPLPP